MQNKLFEFLNKTFKENGFSIFEVGGSVRDELLGLEVYDFDFATNATPEEMLKFLPDTNDTFAKFGCIKYPEMVTPEQRRMAKTINFGIMYGMSSFRLAGELKIPRKSAQEFIDRYFERYSGVAAFIEKTKKQAYEDGFVRTAMGHIRYIPEIRSSNKTIRSMAERVAVNTVIQGTAAEIMKKAMIAMAAELKNRNLKSRMLLQVHDELIFEVPEAEIEEMKTLVRSCMENAMALSVPLKVGLETAGRWGEMH